MDLRAYRDSDAAATRDVFERAVRVTAVGHYTAVQRAAWAPADHDAAAWAAARRAADTLVAVQDDEVIGFGDLLDGTLLDMLYVDYNFARRGIGSALVVELLARARAACAPAVWTDASLIARPVFERHGFTVVAEQTPVVAGVAMTNFRMRCSLNA